MPDDSLTYDCPFCYDTVSCKIIAHGDRYWKKLKRAGAAWKSVLCRCYRNWFVRALLLYPFEMNDQIWTRFDCFHCVHVAELLLWLGLPYILLCGIHCMYYVHTVTANCN